MQPGKEVAKPPETLQAQTWTHRMPHGWLQRSIISAMGVDEKLLEVESARVQLLLSFQISILGVVQTRLFRKKTYVAANQTQLSTVSNLTISVQSASSILSY